MIIVISQSKLLQRAGLWIWHISYGSATPTFHKHFEAVLPDLFFWKKAKNGQQNCWKKPNTQL